MALSEPCAIVRRLYALLLSYLWKLASHQWEISIPIVHFYMFSGSSESEGRQLEPIEQANHLKGVPRGIEIHRHKVDPLTGLLLAILGSG